MDKPLDFQLSLKAIMMPRDMNNYGTIFGGVILSYIDQAGFIEARRHGIHRWVTASIDRVDFQAPVYVGDTVEFQTCLLRLGTTSIKACVRVMAERYQTGKVTMVTEAELTMVSVNAQGKPIAFDSPPSAMENGSEEDDS
ncbi:MAG: acyl-CoA thioesterase [Planctomycetota bacterium]|nr:acyl-CoA thioesterase [Planctomycetota bacterium]